MFEFVNCENISEYENFVKNHKNGSFMQLPQWVDVKSNWGKEIILSRDENGNISGSCLVLIKKKSFLTLLYAPRGPVCDYTDDKAFSSIMEGIDKLARKHRAFTFICDPPIGGDTAEHIEKSFFSNVVTSESRIIQCRFNYMLNLEGKSFDEIRSGFKSDYRNRISKAQRRGVWCEELCGEAAENAVHDFYELMVQTGKRDKFPIRTEDYFTRFLHSLGEYSRMFMCYADIDGKKTPLSGAVTTECAGTFTYVYGASSDYHRDLYPNYLMQQTMIAAAHKNGCRIYDFGGIPYYDDESHSEYGMYKFKRGFGGNVVTFGGQFTKIYHPIINKIAQKFCDCI